MLPPPPPRTPRAAPALPLATLRYGAARTVKTAYPLPGRPQKVNLCPPEIGRVSKRDPTHPPESLTASCEAGREPPSFGEPPARQPCPSGGAAGITACMADSSHSLNSLASRLFERRTSTTRRWISRSSPLASLTALAATVASSGTGTASSRDA